MHSGRVATTAYHFLLLLVGFDTLTYRKDYDRSPILVGHQEPLYPEGHPKRIEQDSQRTNVDAPSPSKKKKKKNDRTLHASREPVIDT